MIKAGIQINKAKIYILGITFKEECRDIRNSKVVDIIARFREYDVDVGVVDPIADIEEVRRLEGIDLLSLADVKDADCLIFAVGHKEFKNLDIHEINGMYRDTDNDNKILIDVKNIFSKEQMERFGFSYWSL